jgi:RHS repeat-associated protein
MAGKTDALGDIVNSARYKPYGNLLSGTQCAWGWTGNSGSRHTGVPFAEQCNWNRHYSTRTKQWISRDILWPSEHAYGYVNGNPVKWIDRLGTDPGGMAGHYGPTTPSTIPSPANSYHPCQSRTADYFAEASNLGFNNKAMNCIATVSGTICLAIVGLRDLHRIASRIPGAEKLAEWAQNLAAYLDCLNRGLYNAWYRRGSMSASPEWKAAICTCNKEGHDSLDCCHAWTNAEQMGLTTSMPFCSKVGTGRVQPVPPPVAGGLIKVNPALLALLTQLEKLFPFNGSHADRWKAAKERCCGQFEGFNSQKSAESISNLLGRYPVKLPPIKWPKMPWE